jgi:predicted molibdopterin-dependent oxidoreductase YjgC
MLRKASLLVVQDILPSPASELADFVIAAGAFSEKEGTLVNYAGLAQGIQKSTRAPGEARPDGRVFMELLERPGLFNAKALRTELAAAIDYFAPLKVGDLGEFGVFLEKQPAAANTVSR